MSSDTDCSEISSNINAAATILKRRKKKSNSKRGKRTKRVEDSRSSEGEGPMSSIPGASSTTPVFEADTLQEGDENQTRFGSGDFGSRDFSELSGTESGTAEENESSEYSSLDSDSSEENYISSMLYNESVTTDSDFLCSLYAIKVNHKLGDSVVKDILLFIKSILPQPNKCPKSMKGFDKLIPKKGVADFHNCCMICEKIKKSDNIDKYKLSSKFKCDGCNGETSTFVTFNIQNQLELILNERNINQIEKSSNYVQNNEINSALDGEIYRKYRDKNLNNSLISFNLNTDGAQIVKHRGYTMWPLLGTIVELNQKTREKFDNIVIFGELFIK